GGWPMSMFLTPEGVPFYGGTYFPPSDRHGMPGFGRVLEQVGGAFRERRREVEDAAAEVRNAISSQLRAPQGERKAIDRNALDHAAGRIAGGYDPVHGGF